MLLYPSIPVLFVTADIYVLVHIAEFFVWICSILHCLCVLKGMNELLCDML